MTGSVLLASKMNFHNGFEEKTFAEGSTPYVDLVSRHTYKDRRAGRCPDHLRVLGYETVQIREERRKSNIRTSGDARSFLKSSIA